ncbi:MAG: hypothetical protein ACLFTK_09455 [Anaerolineales bacterium]
MTHIIMLFLDGIGLGDPDPAINPFAAAHTPTLDALAGGQRWLRDTPYTTSDRAIFIPTDARFGMDRPRPASGSGQAALLTGRAIPHEIGEHYGPKPNQAIRDILDKDNLFITLRQAGKSAALITPYPPGWHAAVERGKRLPSSIQYAVRAAGLPIFTEREYYAGQAVSPDWTGEGWAAFLGFPDAPVYTPAEVGRLLAKLGKQRDFTLFSTWITDEIGHRGPLERGVEFLETTDGVLAGLLDAWQDDDGLIIITSDHGNLEVQGDRRHSLNDVPTVAIGAGREPFAQGLRTIADVTPGILRALGLN